MSKNEFADISAPPDQWVDLYTENLRNNVASFVERHFSIQETLRIQARFILSDLLLYPLNALWALPYLTIKKSLETCEKMGWTKVNSALELIPGGIRTGYQKATEQMILDDFLKPKSLKASLDEESLSKLEMQIDSIIKSELRAYSSSQAMISDLIGSGLTLLAGRYFFHNGSLNILDLGNRVARKMAHDKAVSHFFLGKKLGSTFYHIFPAAPTRTEIYLATLAIGFLLMFFSILANTMSDPIKKKLNLHQNKLYQMIDHIEEKMYLAVRKELKKSTQESQSKKMAV